MAHRVIESKSPLGVVLPDSFEIAIACDMCLQNDRKTVRTKHILGFSDAMMAVRHMKGFLILSEGWHHLSNPKLNIQNYMVCPRCWKEMR